MGDYCERGTEDEVMGGEPKLLACPTCNGDGIESYADVLGVCETCDGTGEVEPCCICGKPSTTDYADDCPSCGSPACEFKMQQAMDYHDEVGNR